MHCNNHVKREECYLCKCRAPPPLLLLLWYHLSSSSNIEQCSFCPKKSHLLYLLKSFHHPSLTNRLETTHNLTNIDIYAQTQTYAIGYTKQHSFKMIELFWEPLIFCQNKCTLIRNCNGIWNEMCICWFSLNYSKFNVRNPFWSKWNLKYVVIIKAPDLYS